MFHTAIIDRAELHSALGFAKLIVDKRSSIPILSNIALDEHDGRLRLRATGLDMMATFRLPQSSCDAGFATTLPAHVLHTVEAKAPKADMISIDAGPETATLDFQGPRYALSSLPIAGFADIVVRDAAAVTADFIMPTADLLGAIKAVEVAISEEETRYYLCGINMESCSRDRVDKLVFVATDGHRLARRTYDRPAGCEGDWNVILPSAAVAFLARVLSAKGASAETRIVVSKEDNRVRFVNGDTDIISKLIDGTFPDYRRVIPAYNDNRLTVDRDVLAAGVKAVTAISGERSAIKITRESSGGIVLTVNDPDMGTATQFIACDMAGTIPEIGFNASYVLSILACLPKGAIELRMGDHGAPANFVAAGTEPGDLADYVLMPMRV